MGVKLNGKFDDLLGLVRGRIAADFQHVRPNLTLRFTTYATWVAGEGLGEAKGEGDDVVCVTDRSSFPIQAALGVEAACCRIASELQDEVIDDLQQPWPAFHLEGRLMVPAPELDRWGTACWTSEDRFVCPIGYLRSSLRIFGHLG